MAVATYLDRFEILKKLSKIGDAKALYLVKRGLNPRILTIIYTSHEDPPATYDDLTERARKIGQNLDINRGLQASFSTASSSDRRVGTGVIFGGSGRPMDTSAGANRVHCYNCGQLGHVSKDCTKPRREKGTCYKCGKKDHLIKDCPIAKRKRATKGKQPDRRVRKIVETGETDADDGDTEDNGMTEEVEEEEAKDFILGDA